MNARIELLKKMTNDDIAAIRRTMAVLGSHCMTDDAITGKQAIHTIRMILLDGCDSPEELEAEMEERRETLPADRFEAMQQYLTRATEIIDNELLKD